MPNYKEAERTAITWQRCCKIVIDNPLDQQPGVRFDEESVFDPGDGPAIKRPLDGISLPFDPAKAFPLRNPGTGDLIPGAASTYGDAYVLLYSAYIAAAIERDTPPVTATQPE
jgi:hypothetical protein